MQSLYLLIISAVLLMIIFTSTFCRIAGPIGLIDTPTSLKAHQGNIPTIGGPAMLASLLTMGLFAGEGETKLLLILYASIPLVFIGMLDDYKPQKISTRIVVQILAATFVIVITESMIVRTGNEIVNQLLLQNSTLAIFITVIVTVATINAFNFNDGIDGLATMHGIALISGLFILNYRYSSGTLDVNLQSYLPILACLSVFLAFNLGISIVPKCFLGDSGSTFLGFICASIIVEESLSARSILPTSAGLILLFPSLMDTISTIYIRLKAKKNIFSGDRNHFHHALIQNGLSQKLTLLVCTITVAIIQTGGAAVLASTQSIFGTIVFLVACQIIFMMSHQILLKKSRY